MSMSSAGTRLHRVEVQRHAALGADRGGLGDRLDDARQVAGPDQRADEVAGPHGLVERVDGRRARRHRPAPSRPRSRAARSASTAPAHRGVLERRRDDAPGAAASRARGPRCCRPRSAAREDDVGALDSRAPPRPARAPHRGPARASRPAQCGSEALPKCSRRNGSIASQASSPTGVVAA